MAKQVHCTDWEVAYEKRGNDAYLALDALIFNTREVFKTLSALARDCFVDVRRTRTYPRTTVTFGPSASAVRNRTERWCAALARDCFVNVRRTRTFPRTTVTPLSRDSWLLALHRFLHQINRRIA